MLLTWLLELASESIFLRSQLLKAAIVKAGQLRLLHGWLITHTTCRNRRTKGPKDSLQSAVLDLSSEMLCWSPLCFKKHTAGK